MVKLVLFDIDGTLIRTGGAGIRAFAQTAAEEFGLPDATAGLEFAGRTDTELVRQVLERHGFPVTDANRQRFILGYLERLEALLRQQAGEICPGVRGLLPRIQESDARPLLGLLTGNVRRGAELKLRAHDLWEWFSIGGFGDDHEDRARIAAIAKQRGSRWIGGRWGRDLEGHEVVVIGDTPRDVACARAVGAKCLAVATGEYSADALRQQGADWVADDLANISLDWLEG